MSLVYIDNNDAWLTEYNICEKLYQDIVETIQQRNVNPKNSDEYSRISAKVRIQLKQYSSGINQLKELLQSTTLTDNLTRDEIERRQRLLEHLQSSNVKVTNMYNNRPNYAAQRNELFADAGTTGWGDDESDEDSPLLGSVSEARDQQQLMIQAQDQGLDALSKVISRQKNIAITISNEVDVQNDLVDDIAGRMDHTNVSIQRETNQVSSLLRDSTSTSRYWFIIILLFIANLIVAFIL